MAGEIVAKPSPKEQETTLKDSISALKVEQKSIEDKIRYRKSILDQMPTQEDLPKEYGAVLAINAIHNNATNNLVRALKTVVPVLLERVPVERDIGDEEDDEDYEDDEEEGTFAKAAGAVARELGPDGIKDVVTGVADLVLPTKNDDGEPKSEG